MTPIGPPPTAADPAGRDGTGSLSQVDRALLGALVEVFAGDGKREPLGVTAAMMDTLVSGASDLLGATGLGGLWSLGWTPEGLTETAAVIAARRENPGGHSPAFRFQRSKEHVEAFLLTAGGVSAGLIGASTPASDRQQAATAWTSGLLSWTVDRSWKSWPRLIANRGDLPQPLPVPIVVEAWEASLPGMVDLSLLCIDAGLSADEAGEMHRSGTLDVRSAHHLAALRR